MSKYSPREVKSAIAALTDLSSTVAFTMINEFVSESSDAWLVWSVKEQRIIAICHGSSSLPKWSAWKTIIPILHYSLDLFYGSRPDITSFSLDWSEQKNCGLSFLRKCEKGLI